MQANNKQEFLAQVALRLFTKFGHDMSKVAIIFPNKRAGIFLTEHFYNLVGHKPFWAPTYYSITELFDKFCPFKADDPIRTVFSLYNICKKYHQNDDLFTIKFFYSWGQQLIADFNNIDSNLAVAETVLTNTTQIRDLEKLDDDHLKLIKRVLNSNEHTPFVKENQETLSHLWDIYKELNKQLADRNEAYQGMRKRKVVELLKDINFVMPSQHKCYVFVGFNVLQKSEYELFKTIKLKSSAIFFWDYNNFFLSREKDFPYINTLKKNISEFGDELENIKDEDLSKSQPQIHYISTSSEQGQAYYASQWICDHIDPENERRTAIVLCNENLLESLLHSIPSKVKEVNITMGFPLQRTQAYSFVYNYLREKKNSEKSASELLCSLKKALYERCFDEESQPESKWTQILHRESYAQCHMAIVRVEQIVNEFSDLFNIILLQQITMQILRGISIPFKGEPATGLQIMGMLETRNLDFDNVLVLSASEGNVPQKATVRSFLPYDVRKHFELSTDIQDTEVYAYNFFRLLQRSKHISFVYNTGISSQQGGTKGEMSRFLFQLLALTNLDINSFKLKEKQEVNNVNPPIVPAEDVATYMEDRVLSPSAIETYITCPMKFFFNRVLGMDAPPKQTDLLKPNTFGSIFHCAAELAMSELMKNKSKDEPKLSPRDFASLLQHEFTTLENLVSKAFIYVGAEDLLNNKASTSVNLESLCKEKQLLPLHKTWNDLDKESKLEVLKNALSQVEYENLPYSPKEYKMEFLVLVQYLRNMLKYDSNHNELTILELEKQHYAEINGVKVGGIIDRVDKVTNEDGKQIVRILDYKTGGYSEEKTSVKTISKLFEMYNDKNGYLLQTFLYSLVYKRTSQISKELPISPSLLFLQKLGYENSDYQPTLTIGEKPVWDFREYEQEFEEELSLLIDKMQKDEFSRCPDGKCRYCAFTSLCGRSS